MKLIDEHRFNVQDRTHWSSASLQSTTCALSSWVVIPADHFPSRAHVICPSFAQVRSFHCAVSLRHLFAQKLSPWYQLAYNAVMRGDFDYMRHCRQLAFSRSGRKRDPLFPSFAHGQRLSSRSSAPSSLSSPKSPFQTSLGNFRFKNLYNNCRMHFHEKIQRNTFS